MQYKNKYRNNFEPNSIDYVNQLIYKIEESIITASKKNNDEVYLELILFLRDDLILKSVKKSTTTYNQLIRIPSNIYSHLSNESKKRLMEVFTIRFTENISFISYTDEIDNEYLEISYFALISLIKKIIDEKNNENYNLILKKISESLYKFNDYKDNYYNFSFAFTILFWQFYLFQNNKIKLKDYNIKLLEDILSQTYDYREELINSFFKYKTDVDKGLWECGDWQIEEPIIGEATWLLMPSTWLNFGFTIMLFKYNILNYGVDIKKINILKNFRFELDDIIKNIEVIEKNKKKWFSILYTNNFTLEQSNDSFDYSKTRIIEFFKILKKEQEIIYYKEISKIPLSTTKIDDFKKNVGNIWDNNSIVPTLLKFYDRVEYLPNVFKKDGIGFFTTMLKSKFAFIDGENYQNIYGLTDFGNKTAREVNKQFFLSLLEKERAIILKRDELKKEVDRYISSLEDKTKVVIFSNWISNDILNNSQNDIEYLTQTNIPFCRSKYKNIPVFNNYELKDYVFIIDLNTIEYKIFQKDNWYNNELLIEITEPIKAEVIEKAKKSSEWKKRDGIEYSEEEILVLEENSINIKILFKFELNILDKSKYAIFKIEN
ncbi:hypothetical protein L1S34_03400 [Flavobacterium sp. K77]|uniref:hypothetical protein n=1 Tax=Flavobacterium sp. K77 TaxID=2910676 RepID=UPI001F33DD9D|nr:hypothetical protein [Flavobacterium sp. K77]MCF6140323.1 hypothetical protein [Flavobacterium sp. K77]